MKFFTTNTQDYLRLDMQYVELEPFEFFKDAVKPTNIISTNRFKLDVFSGTRQATPYFNDVEIVSGAVGVF